MFTENSEHPREYSREARKKLLPIDISAYTDDIAEVVKAMKTQQLESSSQRGYESYLKLFSAWLVLQCNSISFRDINVETLRDYIEFLTNDQGLAPNTINAYLAAIRKMYAVIRNEDLNKRILPDLVVDLHVPVVPSVEEVGRMIKACTTLLEHLLITILITTGMRISEVLALRFKHIEKSNERIFVPYSKGHIAGYVPLSPRVVELLTEYCSRYNASHPGNRLTPDDYVFFNKDRSDHISVNQMRKVYNGIQKLAHLENKHYTFHKLRHYFGYNLYLQSHDLVLVKTVLRHKTTAATLVYVALAASIDAQKRYTNPGELAFRFSEGEEGQKE